MIITRISKNCSQINSNENQDQVFIRNQVINDSDKTIL